MDDPLNPGTPLSHDESIKLAMRAGHADRFTIRGMARFTVQHMPSGRWKWAGGSGGPTLWRRSRSATPGTSFNPLLWPLFPGGQIHPEAAESRMKNEEHREHDLPSSCSMPRRPRAASAPLGVR